MQIMKFVIATLLILASSGSDSGAANTMVTDMHCHAAGIGAGGSGCFISDSMRKSWKYKIYLKSFGVTEQELLARGDGVVLNRLSKTLEQSQSVGAAVVLALDGVVGPDGELDRAQTEAYIPNEFVAVETSRYRNLLFGASINPYRRDALERLDWAAAHGAVLVKWIPSVQNIDPADARLIPFYRRMKELGLPLLTHTGTEHSFTRVHDDFSDPERLRLPLSLGVSVIAAHAGGGGRSQGEWNFDRLLRLCREYPNLYADISSLTQINRPGRLSRVLKQPELQGRLLFGTDMPLINTGIVSPYAFLFKIPLRRAVAIARIPNPWDRDAALKRELGVKDEVFHRAQAILTRPGVRDTGSELSDTRQRAVPISR